MPTPPGLAKPHRILALLPVLLALVMVIWAVGAAAIHIAGAGSSSPATHQVAAVQAPEQPVRR